jgi:hypothetical protein
VAAIAGGYYLGTSLFPEAKTFRLLADILNDLSISLDVFSPYYNSLSIPITPLAFLPASDSHRIKYNIPGPAIRIAALCMSGCLRALCGVCAGGSKAALSVHFASPVGAGASGGDLGDLNAKDGSKETVLGLIGLLVCRIHNPLVTELQLIAIWAARAGQW